MKISNDGYVSMIILHIKFLENDEMLSSKNVVLYELLQQNMYKINY